MYKAVDKGVLEDAEAPPNLLITLENIWSFFFFRVPKCKFTPRLHHIGHWIHRVLYVSTSLLGRLSHFKVTSVSG